MPVADAAVAALADVLGRIRANGAHVVRARLVILHLHRLAVFPYRACGAYAHLYVIMNVADALVAIPASVSGFAAAEFAHAH